MTISVHSLRLRFPELVDVDDAALAFAIEEAGFSIGDSWIKRDRDIAASYLAAHLVSTAQAAAEAGGRELSGQSIGRLSEQYRSSSTGGSLLSSTLYGRRYLELMRMNHPTIVVVGP